MAVSVLYMREGGWWVVRVDGHGDFNLITTGCGEAWEISKRADEFDVLSTIPVANEEEGWYGTPLTEETLDLVDTVVTAIHVTEHLKKVREVVAV